MNARRTRNNVTPVLNPLLAALLALGLLAACGEKKSDKAAARPALTVTTVNPQQQMLPVTLAANGNLAAWQEASVGTEASGLRVAEVLVGVGDRVRRGQVLARFDPASVRADAAQAQASVAEAEASAADAANNAARARTLQQTGAMSASQINQYLTQEKTAQAKVAAARAQLQAQQVRLNQTQVLAPDDGVISARSASATVGAVVNNGTELFRLIRKGRIEWRAEVTASELGKITSGTHALITATSGARLEGRVRIIGPTVDTQSRIAIVYVDVRPLPGPASGSARAGMFARGDFDLGTQPALTVPQQALVVREGFNYLMRVLPDGRIAQVKVQIGRIAGDRVEILSGVDAGMSVVASGGGFLNDGDLVRVANGTATAGAPPAPAANGGAPPASAASAGAKR